MRNRDKQRINVVIEMGMLRRQPISQIVDTICTRFDMTVAGAEDAIHQWEEKHAESEAA